MVRTGLLICLLAILAGPFYTDAGYSMIRHSVSELAGQDTRNAWVMRLGLAALGIATSVGFLQRRNRLNASFLVFGICMVLVAVFPHKPFLPDKTYSAGLDNLHSLFASLGGLAAVMGFIMLAINTRERWQRLCYALVAVSYTCLPVLMFMLPAWQGVFQRLLFFSFIAWAWVEYPRSLPGAPAPMNQVDGESVS